MSNLSLSNGRQIAIPEVARFANEAAPGSAKPFSAKAIHQYAEGSRIIDSVFLTDGKDITVVAKKNLGAAGLKAGDQVKLDGEAKTVLRVNDRPDSYLQRLNMHWQLLKLGTLSELDKLRGGTGGFF